MSNWGGQPQTGQVTFYDPNKFQANAQPAVQQQPHQGDDQQPQPANTWGAWDPGANPYATDFSGNQAVPQEQAVNSNPQQNVGDQSQPVYQQQPGTENQQQQWYGNNWNQEQTYNDQYQWDANIQQWVPNQYNYGDNTGYNNYWAGQNGTYTGDQNGYQTVDPSVQQGVPSANFNSQDPNVQYTTAQQQVPNVLTHDQGSVNVTEQANHLDISQSTESGSADQSVGNVEDGGAMAGFYNDDYDEEEGEDSEEETDEEDDESEGNVESNVNSSAGVGASHVENESDQSPWLSASNNKVHSQGADPINSTGELNNQMQALHLQEHANKQNNANYGYNNDQSNVPPYAYPNQYGAPAIVGNVQPIITGETVNSAHIPAQPSPDGNTVVWPPPVQTISAENVEVDGPSQVTPTPTFSDWEIVPPHVTNTSHSRNASSDNNVQFFIGSTNSSARVSPATSGKCPEEKVDRETVPKVMESAPSRNDDAHADSDVIMEHFSFSTSVKPNDVGLPADLQMADVQSTRPSLPPPMPGAVARVGNPFRKSPNTVAVPPPSVNDASMLSSTQLDITRPNYENSPITLGPSISPIMAVTDNQNQEFVADPAGGIRDTPTAKQTKNSGSVKQSPIMLRKESPFQPPKQPVDQKMKPLKASHDIPGVEAKVQSVAADRQALNRKGRRTPEVEKSRRTPDNEIQTERVNDRRGDADNGEARRDRQSESRNERGYGRKTPDWDPSDKRGGRRTPDRDSRYRSDRDRGHTDRASRQRQSAFHYVNTNRGKDNVSPAASLLDIADTAPAMSNILLVPASSTTSSEALNVSQLVSGNAPLELNPISALITSLSEQIKTDDVVDERKSGRQSHDDRDSKDRYRDRDSREGDRSRYRERDRGDLRGNKSYDSLKDRNVKDSRNDSRERQSIYSSRNSLELDDSRDRGRRGDSRERRYRDDYYDRHR